jgi:serine/threonine-protein kinase
VDHDGNIELVDISPGLYGAPRVSPDGTRIAVEISRANDQIGIYDLRSGVLEQITFESINQRPVWSSDGRRVTFQSNREEGLYNLYWMVCDRSREAEPLTTTGMRQIPESWSLDQVLAFVKLDPDTGADIWTVRPGEAEIPFLTGPSSETNPTFSPDGNWIAYVSNEEGRSEIYVTSFPKSGAKIKISSEGGTNPVWSRSGTELYYRNGDRMMAVKVNGESGFRPSSPRLLFEIRETYAGIGNTGPDGRFVATFPSSIRPAGYISVALEWFEELKERVRE